MEQIEIGPYKIGLIPVEIAQIAKTNTRIFQTEEMLEELMNNIDEIGLLHFPWCTSNGEIYCGGRRLRAFRKAIAQGKLSLYKKGSKYYIPCIIHDCSKEEQVIISLSENFQYTPQHKDDVTKWIQWLLKRGWTLKKIAKKLGVTSAHLGRYLVREQLPEHVKKVLPEKTSLRRDRVIQRFVRSPIASESKEAEEKIAKIGAEIPIDIGESYASWLDMGLPVIEEIREILPFLNTERKSTVKQVIIQKIMLHM